MGRLGIRGVVVPALASLVVAGSVLAQAGESGAASGAGAREGTMGEARPGTMGETMERGRAAMGEEIQGTVKSVDKKKNSLTLSDGKELKLDPSAAVVKDGRTASIKDIKEGDQVRASYEPTPMVHQITVTSPAK